MSQAIIQIVGYVGDAPTLKIFEKGTQKANFSVAVQEYQGKDQEDKTTWYAVETWNGGCDRVMKNVTKGRQIFVTGTLSFNTYVSKKDGKEREVSRPVIRLLNFYLCGKKPEGEALPENAGNVEASENPPAETSSETEEVFLKEEEAEELESKRFTRKKLPAAATF